MNQHGGVRRVSTLPYAMAPGKSLSSGADPQYMAKGKIIQTRLGERSVCFRSPDSTWHWFGFLDRQEHGRRTTVSKQANKDSILRRRFFVETFYIPRILFAAVGAFGVPCCPCVRCFGLTYLHTCVAPRHPNTASRLLSVPCGPTSAC